MNQAAPAVQSPASTNQAVTLHGVVVNAVTGRPIGRALVRSGSTSMLTPPDGKFEVSGLSGNQVTIHAQKPGYYAGLDASQRDTTVSLAEDAQTEIRLYPEALITGTLTAPDGDPVPSISVQALRRIEDETGLRWLLAAQSRSDAEGRFRLPVPPGDYVVETRYTAEQRAGRPAILPLMVPDGASAGTANNKAAVLHMASGSEQHLELRPKIRPTFEVHLAYESAADEGQPQLRAHPLRGLAFDLPARSNPTGAEMVASLPNGTYTISATSTRRGGTAYGETNVTVADHDVSGASIRLTNVIPLQVEVAVDAGVTSDNAAPNPQQLGLVFYRTDAVADMSNQAVSLSPRGGQAPSFTLFPGRYRLATQFSGQWYIKSATLAGTDLLAEELAVDTESSSSPLRLVVSNKTATLKAAVKLGGRPAACWVYLVPVSRGTNRLLSARSDTDGTLTRQFLPPGDYRVVAFETHQPVDFDDAQVLTKLAPNFKTVTLTADDTATVGLDAVPAAGFTP